MAYTKAYIHHTTTEEHPMKRTLTTMTLAAIASAALVLPAPAQAADEPAAEAPQSECTYPIETLVREVEFWRGLAHAGFEAQDGRLRFAEQLAVRTAELALAREENARIAARRDRLARQRDRLAAKVVELRERLAATR